MPDKEQLGTLIVTGASRGIGAAVAAFAGERGYAVAVNFSTGESEAKKVVDSIVASAAIAKVFAVNVSGTILCAREAVRRMSTRRGGTGGAIVNISSRAAHTGSAGEWVHYAASKGAIDSFTIGLAREVATEGVRVNAVAPGLVDTGLHAANGEPRRLQRLMPTIPMQRAGRSHEVAAGVLWLLSPAASYPTGAILQIGGGR